MNRPRLILLVLALGLAAGGLTQGARLLSSQRAARLTLAQRAASLEKQLGDQRRETASTRRELALAEQQLAELPAPTRPVASAAEVARATEIKAWLARVKQLKQLFEQHPDQRVPAMRLLTDDDWLRIAKQSRLDTEENTRKALAALRERSKMKSVGLLSAAMRKYVQAAGTEPPPSAISLAPYLEKPADLEILQGYEIAPMVGRARAGSPKWQLQERAPVDADYDSRSVLNPAGGGSTIGAPWAWIPNFQERSEQASKDYAAANKGAGFSSFAPLLPYFNPPLDPATVEKILKAERERAK